MHKQLETIKNQKIENLNKSFEIYKSALSNISEALQKFNVKLEQDGSRFVIKNIQQNHEAVVACVDNFLQNVDGIEYMLCVNGNFEEIVYDYRDTIPEIKIVIQFK